MRKPRKNTSYKTLYIEALEKLEVLDAQVERLADEYDEAVTQLNKVIKSRNVAQIAEQYWHDNKFMYATLLEQRAREADLDLTLSTDELGDEHLTAK